MQLTIFLNVLVGPSEVKSATAGSERRQTGNLFPPQDREQTRPMYPMANYEDREHPPPLIIPRVNRQLHDVSEWVKGHVAICCTSRQGWEAGSRSHWTTHMASSSCHFSNRKNRGNVLVLIRLIVSPQGEEPPWMWRYVLPSYHADLEEVSGRSRRAGFRDSKPTFE